MHLLSQWYCCRGRTFSAWILISVRMSTSAVLLGSSETAPPFDDVESRKCQIVRWAALVSANEAWQNSSRRQSKLVAFFPYDRCPMLGVASARRRQAAGGCMPQNIIPGHQLWRARDHINDEGTIPYASDSLLIPHHTLRLLPYDAAKFARRSLLFVALLLLLLRCHSTDDFLTRAIRSDGGSSGKVRLRDVLCDNSAVRRAKRLQ